MSTKKTRGLGRGLSVLINDAETEASVSDRNAIPAGVTMIAVDKIGNNPNQPRDRFSAENLRDLTDSVRQHGILQPLLVREHGSRYELIAGERRLRAAREAGLKEVPVVVREVSDVQSLELALVENLQREDLNPIEEAEGYQDLMTRFGLTQEQVAQRVGKARASVANALRLLTLGEEVRLLLTEGRLAVGHAKLLAGIADMSRQGLLAQKSVARGLTVRQLEQLINGPRRPMRRDPSATGRYSLPPDYIRHLSDMLQRHFGTAVRLVPAGVSAMGRKSRGRLEFEFYSNEELQRLLDIMGVEDGSQAG